MSPAASNGSHHKSAAHNLLHAVLIDEDGHSRAIIRQALSALPNVQVLAETDSPIYGYELVRQNRAQLVFIDLTRDWSGALDLVRRITTYVRESTVFVSGPEPTAEVLYACMQAGVREYMTLPLTLDHVTAMVQKQLPALTADRSRTDDTGRVVTVFSNKGGLGKTTIAINLAMSLSEAVGKPVALVDLNLQMGDVTTFLDIEPKQTIVDIVRNLGRVDSAYLRNSMHPYRVSGSAAEVFVLAEPQQLEEAEDITSAQINSVLTVLRSSFDYVVLDVSSTIDAKTLAALDLSDHILLTAIINLPCIRSAQRILTLFDRLGYERGGKVKLVVNRYVEQEDLTLQDVQEALDMPVYGHLRNDYFNIIKSINRGIPLAGINPNCPLKQEFDGLARKLSGVILPQAALPGGLDASTQNKPKLFETLLKPFAGATR